VCLWVVSAAKYFEAHCRISGVARWARVAAPCGWFLRVVILYVSINVVIRPKNCDFTGIACLILTRMINQLICFRCFAACGTWKPSLLCDVMAARALIVRLR